MTSHVTRGGGFLFPGPSQALASSGLSRQWPE
jgi:hypothetical protein